MKALMAALLACACGDAPTLYELNAVSCGMANGEAVEWATQTDEYCNPSRDDSVSRILKAGLPGYWVETSAGRVCCDMGECARLHEMADDGTWSAAYVCEYPTLFSGH